jgi:hypothetical protein
MRSHVIGRMNKEVQSQRTTRQMKRIYSIMENIRQNRVDIKWQGANGSWQL